MRHEPLGEVANPIGRQSARCRHQQQEQRTCTKTERRKAHREWDAWNDDGEGLKWMNVQK